MVQGTTALARPSMDEFRGTHTDPKQTSALLQRAATEFNLVSPAPAVAAIPEGCAVALAAVFIHPDHDTYPIPGGNKLGIGKAGLDRIGLALGLTMIPSECGRLDDGSDPYYVHYRWVGRYRQFDGQLAYATGEKRMDLRPGSAMIQNLQRVAARTGRTADNEIAQMRAFIVEHAETKARLRAIRSLGVKTNYAAAELAKPFVAARLQFTGAFKDPDAQAHYRRRLTDSFLDASDAAYGGGSAPRTLPAPAATATAGAEPMRRLAPPPIAESAADADDFAEEPPSAAAPAAAPAARGDQVRHAEGSENFRLPAKKGTPRKTLVEADYDSLVFWRGRLSDSLAADPNKKYAAEDRDLVAAIERELAARDGTGSDDEVGTQGSVESGAHAGPSATDGAVPAATPGSAARSVVPSGLPGEGKALDGLDVTTLSALRDELSQRLDAAEKAGKGSKEQRRRAEDFLDRVVEAIDRKREPGPAGVAGQSDEQWLGDFDGAGA